MQIGGSDQYGNITAGIDAIKYIASHHPNPVVRSEAKGIGEPFGFTVPLLTTSSGQKFGKSAGNAIWLDSEMTSPFEIYGYFLRTADADVGKYLRMFTFLPIEEIDSLVKEHMESPSQRKAQHKLARDFVDLVHGAHEAREAEMQHRIIFQKGPAAIGTATSAPDPDSKAGIITPNNKPKANITLPRSLIYQKSIGKILFGAGLASSTSEGHRLATKEGAYIGGPPHKTKEPMNDGFISWSAVRNWAPEETRKYLVHDDLLLLRRGKHNVRIIKVISDEAYCLSGDSYPGMTREWKRDVLARKEVGERALMEERKAVDALKNEKVLEVLQDASSEREQVERSPPAAGSV